MKMYETLDMGGMPIKNCPSTGEVVIQETEPTDPHVKWWVVPEKKEVVEVPEYDKEGNPTGGTITQTKITPVTLMYRLPDGTFKAIDSIAGAPGHDGTDGISPTVSMEDLLDDDGKKIGVKLSIKDKDNINSTNILDGGKGEKGDSGRGIVDIVKTGSAGNVDTYTINFTDGTSTTFTVSNGRENEKTSQLENDSGFITKLVSDLANYYTKNETLSTTEITALIEQKANGERVIVEGTDAGKPNVNPEDIEPANTYLVKTTNGYSMWAWISNDWARLGDTDINLSGYYTMGQTDAKFATKAELEPLVKGADLAPVATSGSYNDLADKPTIPNTDGFATTAQIGSKVQAAQAETEAKIPDVSGFRKKTDTIQYSEISGTPAPYTLPIASANTLGGIKIGNGLTLDASTGKVSTQSLVIKKKKITLRIKNPELAKFDDASPTAKQDSAAIPSTDGTYYGKHYHRGNAINWFCDSLSSLGLPIAENIVSITTSFWESGTGIPNIDDDKGIYIMQFTPAPNVKITIPSSMKVTVTYIEEN